MAALPSYIGSSSFGSREKDVRKKLGAEWKEHVKGSRTFKEKTATIAANRATELEAQRQRGDIELAETRGTIAERLSEKGILGQMRTAQEARPFKTGIAEMQYGEPSELPRQRRAASLAMGEESELGKKKVKLKGEELSILSRRLGMEESYLKHLLKGQPKSEIATPSPVYDPMASVDEILNIWGTN